MVNFPYLGPLSLAAMLKFNISKVIYCKSMIESHIYKKGNNR